MVSLGDQAIIVHILQTPLGGGVLEKVRFGHRKENLIGGVFWKVKTQSAKICLTFHFRGEGVFWKRSDLDTRKKIGVWKFRGGGLEKVRFGHRKEN